MGASGLAMRHPMGRRPFAWRKLESLFELVKASMSEPMAGHPKPPVLVGPDSLGVTFIGHSSFFIQIGGRNLLVDPVFATWLVALRRLRRPGVLIGDLPPLDAVLLTHAHMDHLNRPSLRKIVRHTRKQSGRAPVAIVPWGVEDLVADLGFSRVIALEWWQAAKLGELSITLTPAKHWGARFFKDTHRGFGGYVLQANGHCVYHSGDTAYSPVFHEIGRRFSPELALLPIGAYSPENYRNVHTSPEDALEAFTDLGAERMIPMHYGTFRLSYEPVEEPLARLRAAAEKAGILSSICALAEGDTDVTPAVQPALRQGAS